LAFSLEAGLGSGWSGLTNAEFGRNLEAAVVYCRLNISVAGSGEEFFPIKTTAWIGKETGGDSCQNIIIRQ